MIPWLECRPGRLLKNVHAGEGGLVLNDPSFAAVPNIISLTSPAFADGASMPPRFAGAGVGDNLSPPLAWSGLPVATCELVLIVQDPDAPLRRPVVHLIAFRLAPDATSVAEGVLTPQSGAAFSFGQGYQGHIGYRGPRPVLGHGPHRYVFQIFALREALAFNEPPKLDALLAAMASKVLARGSLTGLYERV